MCSNVKSISKLSSDVFLSADNWEWWSLLGRGWGCARKPVNPLVLGSWLFIILDTLVLLCYYYYLIFVYRTFPWKTFSLCRNAGIVIGLSLNSSNRFAISELLSALEGMTLLISSFPFFSLLITMVSAAKLLSIKE